MSVEVKRKARGESFEALLRRFNKRIMQGGVLFQYKKIRFLQKPVSPSLQKKKKLYQLKENDKREYLQKVGLLQEDDRRRKKRRR